MLVTACSPLVIYVSLSFAYFLLLPFLTWDMVIFWTEFNCEYCCAFHYSTLATGIEGGLRSHKTCLTPPHFFACPIKSGASGLCRSCMFFNFSSLINYEVLWYDVHFHWTSTHFELGVSWGTPPGAGFSRCVKDQLVAFSDCLLFGQVVAILTFYPFPFPILW